MPTFEEYDHNLEQVLIDAAADPVFRSLMEPGDIELIGDRGGSSQGQVEALSRGSVGRLLQRFMDRCNRKGADLKGWVCSRNKFNLCAKLDLPPGKAMRALHAFTSNEWVEGGFNLANIFALTAPSPVSVVLTIFGGLCFVDGQIVKLCDCPPRPKSKKRSPNRRKRS